MSAGPSIARMLPVAAPEKATPERPQRRPSPTNSRSETKSQSQCVLVSATFRQPVSLRLQQFRISDTGFSLACGSVCATV